jgi:1,2-diacylglycerol 3-beta-galactosyltransferase
VFFDPLGGPRTPWLLRWVTSLYGPSIRLAPWIWGAAYHVCNSRLAMALLRLTLLALANRPVADAVARHRPAAILSFHPLVGGCAVRGRERVERRAPVVTVVTDLITPHTAWRYGKVDRIVVPSAAAGWSCHGTAPERCVEVGLPVTSGFWGGPLRPAERAALRRSLGLNDKRFLVVLTGGGEGCGGIARRAAAIIRRFDDVDVVAVCGRNRGLERRLAALAARAGGRLKVTGFVENMADWLHCADAVVTKAGPGTIAEATCCGAPLVLTSHVPGQEKGNTEFVVGAGAGRHAPGVRRLVRVIGQLRRDSPAVDAMRAASAGLSRPGAAAGVAAMLAGLVGVPPAPAPAPGLAVAGDRHGPG